jgi:hypothetical protein
MQDPERWQSLHPRGVASRRPPCVTARLVLADGTERTTMMANRTVRGLRMAVKNHPVLAELPERAIGEAGGR